MMTVPVNLLPFQRWKSCELVSHTKNAAPPCDLQARFSCKPHANFYWETLSNAGLASSGRDTFTLAPVVQLHLRLLISSATRRGCYQSPNVPQHGGAARAIRLQELKRLGALRSEMHRATS